MAKDYIEFLSDLKGYIGGSLTFIKPEDSRWKNYEEVGGDKHFGTYPIGLLSNGKNTIEFFSYTIMMKKKPMINGRGA